MIEILHRGKCTDTGTWYTGQYIHLRKTTYCFTSDYDMHPDNDLHQIVFDRMTDWGLPNQHLRADVIPETVGRSTGIVIDRKWLFEGDIVSVCEENGTEVYRFLVSFGECGGVKNTENKVGYIGFYFSPANEETRRCMEFGARNDLLYWVNSTYNCKIIGNRHDNPELLEVTDNA